MGWTASTLAPGLPTSLTAVSGPEVENRVLGASLQALHPRNLLPTFPPLDSSKCTLYTVSLDEGVLLVVCIGIGGEVCWGVREGGALLLCCGEIKVWYLLLVHKPWLV